MNTGALNPRKGAVVRKKVSGVKPAVPPYELRLYVAGQTRKSLAAFANLKKILIGLDIRKKDGA